jgi:hypothetical protein
MSVTSGQYGIAQSKTYHPYLNGKSQFVTMTTANLGAATNVEKSIGYISSDATGTFSTGLDGFRLYKSTTDVYAFEVWRNGSILSNQLLSAWSDKLDGTGASGMNINWNNFNVFVFDFLYLGGTCINCYVMYNGQFRLFNTYYHANTDASPMFNSPNKPVRWEIRSSTGSGNMDVVCAEVATEGIVDTHFTYGNGLMVNAAIAGINAAVAGTSYALCGIRKKTTHRDIFALIESFEGICSTADYVQISIVLNPTVAGTFTYADVINTPFQTATGAATNTVTGGTKIASTYVSQGQGNVKEVTSVLTRLSCTLNNTMDAIVLVATPALGSTAATVSGTIDAKWFT